MLKQWYCQVQAIDLTDSQAETNGSYPKKTRVVHILDCKDDISYTVLM
jgi:hypothetical protein